MRKTLWMAALACAACGSDKKSATDNVAGITIVTPVGGGDAAPEQPATEGFTGPQVAIMGRSVVLANNAGTQLAWAGSRVTARVFGTTQVAIGLRTSNAYNPTPLFFDVTIDGGAPTRFALDSANPPSSTSYPLTLPDAKAHVVRWTKITEASSGQAIFTGVTPGPGGSLLPTPTPTGRHIEFIGDSIVNGYGVLGSMVVGTSTCSGSSSNTNADLSFATLTANALAAEYTLIAYSGRGLATNLDGSTQTRDVNANNANNVVPAMFLDALPPTSSANSNAVAWDPNRLTPDVVVINLGTNDFGYTMNQQSSCTATSCNPDATAFTDAYVAFLREVRATYPAALIVPAVGAMLSNVAPPKGGSQHDTALAYVTDAVNQFGDANTYLYDFGVQDTKQPTGCAAHPSAAEHQLMALGGPGQVGLAAFIKTKMNWN